MELLAEGRTAEVFAWDSDQVVKLDRPEWNGLADHEARILSHLGDSGLAVPRVFGTVEIDGRRGVVLERLEGPLLAEVIRAKADPGAHAAEFVALQATIHAVRSPNLPALSERLAAEVGRVGLPQATVDELLGHLRSDRAIDGTCHCDLHPSNVIVTPAGWRVIDWLTAATGPVAADLARLLVLGVDATEPSMVAFVRAVRSEGQRIHDLDDVRLDAWVRVMAASRMAEGFAAERVARLREVALGGLAAL